MSDSERVEVMAQRFKDILRLLPGEDVEREGLVDTPKRFSKALLEMTQGYAEDPVSGYLSKVFTCSNEEMVVVKGVAFTSLCEHHVLPFVGVAHVGYLPNGKVVGLSKIPRTVQAFAKRLQIQEQLTQQIAHSMEEALQPRGVAVVIEAEHQCMACRGVRSTGTSMVTSSMLGAFREDDKARQEFLALVR